jgi:carbamoyl-phosphate synthase small subunit
MPKITTIASAITRKGIKSCSNKQFMSDQIPARLVLEDGSVYSGNSFGYREAAAGEVVFNTAMTGYPENLSDPSYAGQLLVATYPLIGNYGVPDRVEENGMLRNFESDKLQVSGLIVSDYSFAFSHWNASKSLADWLKSEKVPGICGIDTRSLTKRLRERGTMPGKIVFDDADFPFYNPNAENLVAKVSTSEPVIYGNGRYRVALIDCGVKNNIIRCLIKRDATVIKLPWDYDFTAQKYDGIVLSNGPGDPQQCQATIEHIRKALEADTPIFGICLGNQLLSIAGGASTYKLKYGHRSHNQPVIIAGTSRTFITSQNHGFAVDNSTLGEEWEPYFINLNDGTNEGIRHKSKPFFSSQFHPEASSGPTDTEFLFDDFFDLIRNGKH